MKSLRILHVLVCDDVRREENGKEILIGVYSGGIRVARMPVNMRLVFWSHCIIMVSGPIKLWFRVSGPNNIELAMAEVEIEVAHAGHMGSVPFGPVPMQIQAIGDLRFAIRDEADGQWDEVLNLPITIGGP